MIIETQVNCPDCGQDLFGDTEERSVFCASSNCGSFLCVWPARPYELERAIEEGERTRKYQGWMRARGIVASIVASAILSGCSSPSRLSLSIEDGPDTGRIYSVDYGWNFGGYAK